MPKEIGKNTKLTITVGTIIGCIGFVCGVVAWSVNVNHRLTELESFKQSVNFVEIQTTLSEIKTDIQWLKNNYK